jgi:hypothetical protein
LSNQSLISHCEIKTLKSKLSALNEEYAGACLFCFFFELSGCEFDIQVLLFGADRFQDASLGSST